MAIALHQDLSHDRRSKLSLILMALLCFFVLSMFLAKLEVGDLGTATSIAAAAAVVLIGIGYAYGQLQTGRNRNRIDALKVANAEVDAFSHRIQALETELARYKTEMDVMKSLFGFDPLKFQEFSHSLHSQTVQATADTIERWHRNTLEQTRTSIENLKKDLLEEIRTAVRPDHS